MCVAQVGTVKDKESLFIHMRIGEFDIDGKKFEISISANQSPIIKHPDGRAYFLSWQDIANLALDAFEENTELAEVNKNEH